MVTAEITFSRKELINLKYPVELPGVDWKTYKEISDELGESSSLHISFKNGLLTIMPVTELHELLTSLLDKFIILVAMNRQIDIVSTGKATLRSEMRNLVAEPDLSYFVSGASSHKIKSRVPDEVESPPDIVVEIDLYHFSDRKFEIYNEFGVSEFWQYKDGKLKIFGLQADRTYSEMNRSQQLPILSSEILTQFLNRGESDEQIRILTDFQAWLQNQ